MTGIRLWSVSAFFAILALEASGQDERISAGLWAGTIVAGYVDHGGYINCVGPNIRYGYRHWSVAVGLLPSIRVKKDRVRQGETRNAMFMPSLGTGATLGWRKCVLQVPLFYQPKTSSAHGRWHVGFGVGWQL